MPTENTSYTRMGSYTRTGTSYDPVNPGKTKPVVEGGPRIALRQTLSRTSASTPGFHNPKRTGRLLPNAFSFSLDVDTSETGIIVTKSPQSVKPGQYGYLYTIDSGVLIDNPDWYSNSDNDSLAVILSPSDLDTLDRQARNALLTKIKNQNVNVAVATAEAGKTMKMVGDTAITIAGALHDLRRGDFVGAARGLGIAPGRRASARFSKAFAKDRAKAIGSGWNSLSYGWRPLLDDVYGAAKECAGAGQQGIVCTSKVRKSRSTPIRFVKRVNDSYERRTITQIGYNKTDVQYSVTYTRSLGAPQDLPRLGITNPAVVAWELVPYSFVVDWFLPIGNWLGTLDATLGVNFHSGYRTTFQRCEATQNVQQSSKTSESSEQRQSAIRKVRVKRTVLGDFPSPALPTFKNPATFGHMMNGLALLTNLIRK